MKDWLKFLAAVAFLVALCALLMWLMGPMNQTTAPWLGGTP